jgi:hypothetical protein
MDFSSWSREQEATFVVYEQRRSENQSKALIAAVISGALFFVVAVGIFLGVEPDRRDISKDMNMSNLTKKKDTVEKK